ncbi:hypothetical protein PG994_013787 [Apiospora phragmitis]|uniref:Uncharacterized protein n=1 Tax=Apiospora phragmitis TaxID=2905665 RepID=A0ABR1T2H5_9PEZI
MMIASSTSHGRSLSFVLFLFATLFAAAAAAPLTSAHPIANRETAPVAVTAAAAAAVTTAADAPLYLAPFPNENSTDAHVIPDEYIIALFPESSYAALDAFMTETYGGPLDPARVEVLVKPGDPPRFDSYLWAHGVSAGWLYQVRTFPGTKRVSRNGYAQGGS